MKMFTKPYDLLIVDDQEEIVSVTADMIYKIYTRNMFNIICVTDAKEALKYLEKIHFHILITDIFMPNMLGDELMRKALDMKKGTQCIVITSDNMVTTVINAYNDGAVAFIPKPIEINKLKNALDLSIARLNYWAISVTNNLESKNK